ncbi:hypothetical protein Trydic_g1319 [Trypoxylus dichotomus]
MVYYPETGRTGNPPTLRDSYGDWRVESLDVTKVVVTITEINSSWLTVTSKPIQPWSHPLLPSRGWDQDEEMDTSRIGYTRHLSENASRSIENSLNAGKYALKCLPNMH